MRIVAVCGLLCSPILAAPPTLDHLFPAGGQQGATVEVTATGKFDTWPVQVWTDREGLLIEPEKAKGKLKVTVRKEAAGTYWIRLHNKDGATAIRPFVVSNLPEVVETEPNDDPQEPQQLKSSCIVNGKLAKSGDVDGFSIQLTRGQTAVVSMTAKRVIGSPMDAVIQVCDENGFVLAQNDDAGSLDPHLIYESPSDGIYLIRAFAFPETPNSTINFAGASNFIYRLTITTGGFVEYCLPMTVQRSNPATVAIEGWNIPPKSDSVPVATSGDATRATVVHPLAANAVALPIARETPVVALPDSSSENPQAIEIPSIVSGALANPGAINVFSFRAEKGRKVNLRVQSRLLGFPLDAVLQVNDASGKLIKEVDDAVKNHDPEYTLTAAQAGDYRVSIRDLHGRGGKRFAYQLAATYLEPSYEHSVATDLFGIEIDKELEIPITMSRQNGFKADVTVEALDLPAGITATAVVSQSSGATAKTVKLKLKATSTAKGGPFRIVGRVSEQSEITATYSQAIPATRHDNLWIHVSRGKAAK